MANVRRWVQKIIQVARDIFRHSHLPVFDSSNPNNDFQPKQSCRYKSRENNTILERQLESSITSLNSAVLLSNKNVSGGYNGRPLWDEKTVKTSEPKTRDNAEKGRCEIVPTQTLPANSHVYFNFNLGNRGTMFVYLESEFPINVYAVDETGFNNFRQGLEFTDFGGNLRQMTTVRTKIRVPYNGNWYLIFDNPNDQNTAIHYEVN